MYTKVELDTAYERLKAGENPRKLYVYFKDASELSDELREFRDEFPVKYGHFFTHFGNFDTLKAHFLLQFMEYLSQFSKDSKTLEVKDGKVFVGGEEYVNLQNVPFAANNDEYNLLKKNIKKTQKLLSITETDDPDYAEYAAELYEMQEKLSKMERGLWDTALMITKLTTTRCSERLTRAMELFNGGDAKGAQAILNEDEIEKDVEHNINLIRLGEEGRKGIRINIEEYKLKISILNVEMPDGWLWEQLKLREKVIELTKILYGEESLEVADECTAAAEAYYLLENYQSLLDLSLSALAIREKLLGHMHLDTAQSYNDAGVAYGKLGDIEKQFEYTTTGLDIREALDASDLLLAESYNTVGMSYLYMEEADLSLEYSFRCLELRRKALGEMHQDTANAYENVGAVYAYFGYDEEGLEYTSKALAIVKHVLGDNHPDTAKSYNNLGEGYRRLGQYEMALECEQTAISLTKRTLGEYSYLSLTIHTNMAAAYLDMGNIDQAKAIYERMLLIAKHIYGDGYLDCDDCVYIKECIDEACRS